MADLSNETFKSFTDEAQSSGSFISSEGHQSWPSASGSKHESGKPATLLEHPDKQSEVLDLNNNEKKLSRKWINCLKSKETNSGHHQTDPKPQTEVIHLSDEEMNALQSFCTTKTNLIRQRVNSNKKKTTRQKMLQLSLDAEPSEIAMLNCTVPDELLNRIYLKNIRSTPKQIIISEQHISSQCSKCNSKRAELAQSAFLKQKKTLLESLLLHEKIDERLHTKDVLTFIGEAHQDLPRLSDDPRIIWKRLNEKLDIEF